MDILADSFVSNYTFSTVFNGGGEGNDVEEREKQVAGIPVNYLLGSGNQTGGDSLLESKTPQLAGLAVPAGLVVDSRKHKKYNSNRAHYDGGNGNYSVIDDDLFDTLYNSVAKERNKKSNGTQKSAIQKIRPSRKHRKST